jgi:hypothetical protein
MSPQQRDELAARLEGQLHERAQLGLLELLTKSLGSGDLILLRGLGINAKQKLLQAIIAEANKLLEEQEGS